MIDPAPATPAGVDAHHVAAGEHVDPRVPRAGAAADIEPAGGHSIPAAPAPAAEAKVEVEARTATAGIVGDNDEGLDVLGDCRDDRVGRRQSTSGGHKESFQHV